MKHLNSPNQTALTYRMGTHPTFLRDMLARVRTQPVSDGKRPLAGLTTRASDDPAIALLDAWAVAGDVLTFYQERIANEGYLRTGTELHSVVELARTIGYQLKPGLAASTSLAFTVEAVDTSGIVTLKQGIKVQSVPGQDQFPQTFETLQTIKARPEWNSFEPDRRPETIRQTLKKTTSQLELAGTNTGLEAGDKLLIVGDEVANDPNSERWYLLTLQGVTLSDENDSTIVTWGGTLEAQKNIEPPTNPKLFAFRQQAALFGHNAPQWKEMPAEIKREKSGVKSGFYRFTNQNQWEEIEFQSPSLEFQALAAHRRGTTDYLFAGTAEEGVFRSTDNGQTWTACNTGLTNLVVNALFSDDRQYLFAGTTNGMVLFSTDDGDNWSQLSVGSLVEHVITKNSSNQVTSQEWKVVQDGLPNSAIRALLSYQQGATRYFFVGTNDGVYRSDNNGTTWQAVNSGLPANSTIHALSRYQPTSGTAYLFAASNDKVYRSTNDGDNWTEVSTPSDISDIRALVSRNNTLFAGTRNALFEAQIVNDMNQASWSAADGSEPKDIRALALLNDELFAPTPFAGSVASEWPGFEIEEDDQRIDLDTVYNRLLADSWIVLLHESHVAPYQIQSVSTVQGDDFTLRSKTSRLQLTRGQGLASFGGANLRGSELLLQSEPVALFEQTRARTTPVEGERITLDGRIPTLEVGRRVIVSGKRRRIKIPEHLTNPLLQNQETSPLVLGGSEGGLLKAGDVLEVMSPPKEVEQNGQIRKQWELRDNSGFTGTLLLEQDEDLIREPAYEADEIVSEVGVVKGMSDDGERVTITLRDALEKSYDRATVTIQANIVQATHGETVADEVLGSGDGTQANQRFRLKKPPLTYLPAPTESGVRSTLTVRVNGIEWEEAATLNDLDERCQSYIVRHDSASQPYIIFGDGQKGARLPSGIENVVATYRSGIGLEGEVEVNTLVLLQTSPLGVLEVSNPVPASGAAPPDKLDDTRQNAPLSVLTMDRIVSLSDFEDFTRTFAGIGKVQGKLLWTGHSYLVHLTIADSDGDGVPESSALYESLVKAINERRNPLLQKMQIDSYDPLFFKLAGTIFVDPRYKKENVERDVKDRLQETFSFSKRAFAQDVAASDVIAVMQNVAGVVAVDLDELYIENNPQQLNNLLPAEPARWEKENEKGEAKPAQLLLLKKDGITLTMNP
jgi:hypothetical protein